MCFSRLIRTWVPVVVWAGVIFAFSSVSDLGTGLGTWDLVLRKIAHFCEYGILGLLLARAADEPVAVAVGVAYAGSDELHQHFVPGRHAAFRDLAVDAAGVLTGVIVARIFRRRAW